MNHSSLLYILVATAFISLLFFIFFNDFSALFPIAVAIVPITVSIRAARRDDIAVEEALSDEQKRNLNRAFAVGFAVMSILLIGLAWWALSGAS